MKTRAGDMAVGWQEDLRHARRNSQSFYRDLLAWAYEPDRGHGEASEWSAAGRERMQKGPVSLLSKWDEGERRKDVPEQCWVQVEDVEECVNRARELGASVEMAPLWVKGVGQVATLRDPAGTLLSLIQHAA